MVGQIFVVITQLDLLESIYSKEHAARLISAHHEHMDDTMAVELEQFDAYVKPRNGGR